MEIGIFDIYFSHTIEYRICSSLFFWIFGNIYSIFYDIPYHRKSNITIENRTSGYTILAATDPLFVGSRRIRSRRILSTIFFVGRARSLVKDQARHAETYSMNYCCQYKQHTPWNHARSSYYSRQLSITP